MLRGTTCVVKNASIGHPKNRDDRKALEYVYEGSLRASEGCSRLENPCSARHRNETLRDSYDGRLNGIVP